MYWAITIGALAWLITVVACFFVLSLALGIIVHTIDTIRRWYRE